MSEKRSAKYWICDECAKKKGWKPVDWAVTIIKGLCGYCERTDETFLTPTVDFHKGGGKEPIFD